MATKRKTTSKKPTKKDLESKIAELEAKLGKLSSQLDTKPAPKPAQTTQSAPPPPPPPPKAESPKGSLPKGMEQKPAEAPPKPAEQAAGLPASNAEALEQVYNSFPMTNTHDYKTKTPGFTPAPNRYYARRTAPRGTAPTQNWNIQKAVVTGYTACSNQYYATKARMAYHPPDKTFNGLGLKLEGVAEAQTTQSAPPPPPPQEPPKQKGTLPKGMEQPQAQVQTSASSGGNGSRKDELEAYEADYLARLEKDAQEAAELQRAAEELAAKKRAESASSSGGGSSRGTLPKGF